MQTDRLPDCHHHSSSSFQSKETLQTLNTLQTQASSDQLYDALWDYMKPWDWSRKFLLSKLAVKRLNSIIKLLDLISYQRRGRILMNTSLNSVKKLSFGEEIANSRPMLSVPLSRSSYPSFHPPIRSTWIFIVFLVFHLLSVYFMFLSSTIYTPMAHGLTYKYVLRIIGSFYDLCGYRRLLYAGRGWLWWITGLAIWLSPFSGKSPSLASSIKILLKGYWEN